MSMLTIDTRIQTDITTLQVRPANPEQNSATAKPQSTTNTINAQKTDTAGVAITPETRGKTSLKEMEEAVKSIQKDMELLNTRIAFRVDKKSNEIVVDVIDKDTNKVIRQIPSEEMLRIKTAFKELIKGLLLDTTI